MSDRRTALLVVWALAVIAYGCASRSEKDRRADRLQRWRAAADLARREMPAPKPGNEVETCAGRSNEVGGPCDMSESARMGLRLEVSALRDGLLDEARRACDDAALQADLSAAKLRGLADRCRALELEINGAVSDQTLNDPQLRRYLLSLQGRRGSLLRGIANHQDDAR